MPPSVFIFKECFMSLQLAIIIGYLLLTVAVGALAVRRGGKNAAAFHGAGLGIFMCVAAGTGEWLGGTSTTGVAEYSYMFGLSGAWYTIANALGIVFLAVLFARLYRSLDVITVPAILGKFAGRTAQSVASFLLIFVMVAVGTAQVVGAGALGAAVLGLDFTVSVIVLGIGFIVYTLRGGMLAVGYTNVLHLVAMYGGILLAVVVVCSEMGGLSGILASLPEKHSSMFGIGKGTVFSWLIASILGACTAQAGIQPLLAAKDETTARTSAFITAVLVAPFGVLVAVLGMAAKVRFPELANAKMALPALMMSLHPAVGGAVLAAIMAAILSTISPLILASGTMFTMDLYKSHINPQASNEKLLQVSKIATGISGIACVAMALLFAQGTRILDMVYFAYTQRGALFVVLLLSIYWKGSTGKGAVMSMLLTAFVGFAWISWKAAFGAYPLHPAFSETFAAVLCAAITMPICSLLTKSGSAR